MLLSYTLEKNMFYIDNNIFLYLDTKINQFPIAYFKLQVVVS